MELLSSSSRRKKQYKKRLRIHQFGGQNQKNKRKHEIRYDQIVFETVLPNTQTGIFHMASRFQIDKVTEKHDRGQYRIM